jgi:hypothetical protein
MQVKPFAAKHSFVNRIVLVSGNGNFPVLFLINNHAAANPALTAGCGKRLSVLSGCLHAYTLF